MFNAILVNKDDQGYRAELTQVNEASLPEGDVRVKVLYSTLNYKDGLAITGKGPVVRSFPMVPGIDFAGEVGTDKGSWKGGLCGTSIRMLDGELHEAAFRRFCDLDQRGKYSSFKLKFIGPA